MLILSLYFCDYLWIPNMLLPVWHGPELISDVWAQKPTWPEPHSAPGPGCRHQTAQAEITVSRTCFSRFNPTGFVQLAEISPKDLRNRGALPLETAHLLFILVVLSPTSHECQLLFWWHQNKLLLWNAVEGGTQKIRRSGITQVSHTVKQDMTLNFEAHVTILTQKERKNVGKSLLTQWETRRNRFSDDLPSVKAKIHAFVQVVQIREHWQRSVLFPSAPVAEDTPHATSWLDYKHLYKIVNNIQLTNTRSGLLGRPFCVLWKINSLTGKTGGEKKRKWFRILP